MFSQAFFTGIQGGKLFVGFAAGSLSSVMSSLWQGGEHITDNGKEMVNGIGGANPGTVGTMFFGTISGGAGAAISGGNFWQGAVTGLVVSGLNHTLHKGLGDPPVKKRRTGLIEEYFDTWFFENQFFGAEAGLRAGTYIDFTPLKKVLGIKIGEYKESVYKAEYYDYKGSVTHSNNHYFEFAASAGLGVNYKYNLGQNRFESFSISFIGISLEYSIQSSYQSQIYFGIDTGFSLGAGIGGFANIKGGWIFDF